jgi:hypothetical protein
MGHGGSEVAPENLDDERDRAELRDRYYGLLQEVRVVLPGVQVLVAFLLTVPFAQRFGELDNVDRGLYGVALLFTILSAIAFISPTALHRFGSRTARGQRLRVSILMTRVGLLCLGVGIALALLVVSRFLFATAITALLVGITVLAMVTFWIIVPRLLRGDDETDRNDRGA